MHTQEHIKLGVSNYVLLVLMYINGVQLAARALFTKIKIYLHHDFFFFLIQQHF